MIAGVPRPVITLYAKVCEVGQRFTTYDDPDRWRVHVRAKLASVPLANDATQLLRDTLWRPVLMLPRRWWRTWRLRRKALRLYGEYWPSVLPRSTYRSWIKEDSAGRRPSALPIASACVAPGTVLRTQLHRQRSRPAVR
jgi:hypothetical protein